MAMQRSHKNEAIVGLFTLIAIGVLLAMTFIIRGSTGLNPYRVRTTFPNVAGLEIGSPVLVQGFRLGRVVEMLPGTNEDGDSNVIVVMNIARTIPIYEDARVYLVQQGFIGDKRLEIDPGNSRAGEINDGFVLNGVPPADLQELFAKAGEMLDDLSVTLKNVRQFTSDESRIAQIDDTLRNINDSTSKLNAILEENRTSIRTTTENVEELSRRTIALSEQANSVLVQAEENIAQIGDSARTLVADFNSTRLELEARLKTIVERADSVGENANELLITSREEVEDISRILQRTARTLDELLVEVNRGEGTVGRLIKDPQPFEDLSTAIAGMRRVLQQEDQSFYSQRIPYRPNVARQQGDNGTLQDDARQ